MVGISRREVSDSHGVAPLSGQSQESSWVASAALPWQGGRSILRILCDDVTLGEPCGLPMGVSPFCGAQRVNRQRPPSI